MGYYFIYTDLVNMLGIITFLLQIYYIPRITKDEYLNELQLPFFNNK